MTLQSDVIYRETRELPREGLLALYRANEWSSAEKPNELYQALVNSHALITAWDGERLIGLGNAMSDGHLVVYYPHLLVLPEYHGRGVGRAIMERLTAKYSHLHQQMVTADGAAIGFYEKCGFKRAGRTQSMWIYDGTDH